MIYHVKHKIIHYCHVILHSLSCTERVKCKIIGSVCIIKTKNRHHAKLGPITVSLEVKATKDWFLLVL